MGALKRAYKRFKRMLNDIHHYIQGLEDIINNAQYKAGRGK